MNSDLGPKLGRLAEQILDELLTPGSDIKLDQRIDALKAIGTLHLGLKKISAKLEPDEEHDSVVSMTAMRKRLRATDKGE